MALHDIDKRGQMRLDPVTNFRDKIPPEVRQAHGTTQFTNRDEEDTTTVKLTVDKAGSLNVTKADGNNNIRIGFLPDGEGGEVIAKDGQTVDGAFA